MAATCGAIFGIIRGDVPHMDHLATHAGAMADLAEIAPTLFPESSKGGDALDAIWEDAEDFASKLNAFKEATAAFKTAAESGERGRGHGRLPRCWTSLQGLPRQLPRGIAPRRRGDPSGRPPRSQRARQGARSPVSGRQRPAFPGTGRHKGVPYDGLSVVWRFVATHQGLSYTRQVRTGARRRSLPAPHRRRAASSRQRVPRNAASPADPSVYDP